MANFCSNCGKELQVNSKFCPSCGHELTPMPEYQPVQPNQYAPMPQQASQPGQVEPLLQQSPPQNGPAQQFGPPHQHYVQQPYMQAAQYQQSYSSAGVTKKKSKLPLILGIAGGVVALMVVTVIIILNSARAALNKTAQADYYEIGNDQIPSVKLALDDERTVTGVSTSVQNGATIMEITYSVPGSKQKKDMSDYLVYLQEEDDFLTLTDIDFSGPESWGGLGRNSVDDGYEILVEIDYNKNGYTITLVRQEGEIAPVIAPAFEPTPEPTPAVTADVPENPEHYADEDETEEAEPWVGLWRYEDEEGVELIHLEEDSTFIVRWYSRSGSNDIVMTGTYYMPEGNLVFTEMLVNGNPHDDLTFYPFDVTGDTMTISEDTYCRVQKADETKVLADPFAPYVSESDTR